MATSYFLRPSSPLEREEPHESMVVREQKIRSSETVKQKAGKNGKAATNRKKQLQRGLGVAQLERLISQPDSGPVSPNLQHPFYQFQFPSTYGVPAATVLVPFGGGGAGDGQGSFGFIPWRYTINGGFAGVSVQTTLDQVPVSPFEPKELTLVVDGGKHGGSGQREVVMAIPDRGKNGVVRWRVVVQERLWWCWTEGRSVVLDGGMKWVVFCTLFDDVSTTWEGKCGIWKIQTPKEIVNFGVQYFKLATLPSMPCETETKLHVSSFTSLI